MRYEKSCGAVIYTIRDDEPRYVIIGNLSGTYGFPKGHAEQGETEKQTALREVKEEVGLDIEIVDGFKEKAIYKFSFDGEYIEKEVTFFLGHIEKMQELIPQPEEISFVEWKTFDEAISMFQYENSKEILTAARQFIESVQ